MVNAKKQPAVTAALGEICSAVVLCFLRRALSVA